MRIIPPGTYVFEPDGIHQVTLQFPTQDDAIIFYEWLLSAAERKVEKASE
jgi:hypothetical protein